MKIRAYPIIKGSGSVPYIPFLYDSRIPRDATLQEVKRMYHELAKEYVRMVQKHNYLVNRHTNLEEANVRLVKAEHEVKATLRLVGKGDA